MLVSTSEHFAVNYQETSTQLTVAQAQKVVSSQTNNDLRQSTGLETSSLVALSTSLELSELSIQGDRTTLAYRRDGSLALQASSTYDISLRSQVTTVDLTISADLLGTDCYEPEDFANGPIQFSFETILSSIDVNYSFSAQKVSTTKKPEEVLSEMVSSIRKALNKNKGSRIRLELDQEALQAMMGDQKMLEALQFIAALLMWINTQAALQGKRGETAVSVSGKGKPYWDVQEKTQVQALSQQVKVNITITPPQGKAIEQCSAGATTIEKEA